MACNLLKSDGDESMRSALGPNCWKRSPSGIIITKPAFPETGGSADWEGVECSSSRDAFSSSDAFKYACDLQRREVEYN